MAIYQGETRVANNYQIDNSVYCVPIGSIIPYASTTLPKGFLLCDGAEISKTDYADLYAVIGDTFGTATNNTKFKLPDLRDKFVQGANDNLGTSKEAGLPNITGEWIPGSVPDVHNQYTKGAVKGTSGVSDNIASYAQKQTTGYGFSFDASNSNSIYGNSTTVQPPAVCLCYIIKATKLSDIPVDVSGVIDDNTTGADSTWSSEKIDEVAATKLDNTKLTSETESGVVIYVNSTTGSDDNDGTNAAEPMKTISFEKIHQRFGYPKSILIILTEDYDIAGTPIDAKGEQWVGIRGSAETLPYKKIYSSVTTDTLVKAERTQVSYNYLTLDGTNATTSLVYSDCNCCYFDNVQAVTNNVATESLINARRANIMAKNSAFSSNKTDTSVTSLVSGYNSIITLDTCTVSVRNLSSAVNSIATKIDGSISYVNETKDDNTAYELSVVRHSEIPTSLPANGGNADTLDSKHASDFLQNQGILSSGDLLEHILTMTDSGYFFASSSVTSTPVEGQWFWVEVRRDERGDYCVTATRYNQGGVYTNRYNNNDDMKKWYGWSNVASTVINDSATTSTTETLSANKINNMLSMFPFEWELIGISEPETGKGTSNTFEQTMSSGNPFCVYHSSGVFCFGNGVPANRGKLYGMTAGQVATVTYTNAGLLTVTVGSGKAYIYQMKTIS